MIVYGSAFMIMKFRAERVVLPPDDATAWVVVDDDFGLHVEACAFLAGLRGLDRSVKHRAGLCRAGRGVPVLVRG
ncbi:hypothetical protein ACU61A_37350 [Pseudonocardia sichuanensis]|uniref:hypothetical protein n=1 Tax=Pseudonocardia kunmingensis TaxID=630975 RepID=UPI001B873DAC|nr:hypothetical protein [Pseudonocardia kunmingensis]